MTMSKHEQRQILEMQAELARLKIAIGYLKNRRDSRNQTVIDTGFNKAVALTNRVICLSRALPSRHILWNSIFLPLRWRYRIMAAIGLLLWKYCRGILKSHRRV